jgi:hypothetical protein
MTTNLNSNDLLPLEHPYSASPWSYEGVENVQDGFYTTAANVVDWVLIELRTGTAASTIVSKRACFVLSDGTLAEIDGSGEKVAFNDEVLTAPGSYYVVVRHRNHLAVMTAEAVSLDNPSTLYDFTSSAATAYGSNSLVLLSSGKYGLFSCDANLDGFVTSSDFNLFYTKFRNLADGYDICDWNMDGYVTSSDFNIFYSNFRNLAKSNVPN